MVDSLIKIHSAVWFLGLFVFSGCKQNSGCGGVTGTEGSRERSEAQARMITAALDFSPEDESRGFPSCDCDHLALLSGLKGRLSTWNTSCVGRFQSSNGPNWGKLDGTD